MRDIRACDTGRVLPSEMLETIMAKMTKEQMLADWTTTKDISCFQELQHRSRECLGLLDMRRVTYRGNREIGRASCRERV